VAGSVVIKIEATDENINNIFSIYEEKSAFANSLKLIYVRLGCKQKILSAFAKRINEPKIFVRGLIAIMVWLIGSVNAHTNILSLFGT
jgi:hypothetical protein